MNAGVLIVIAILLIIFCYFCTSMYQKELYQTLYPHKILIVIITSSKTIHRWSLEKKIWKKYFRVGTKFLYVYESKPTFTHWKLSSEYVCLPTHDTNAFPSLLECTNAMSGKIRNRRVFVQNSSEPLYVLSTVSKHPFRVRSRKLPSTVDSLALIVCLLLLYYSINFS